MGAFTPSFSALFAEGMVEQCMAILQTNQAAAIAAYNTWMTSVDQDPYGPLEAIADWHKGELAAPNFPCCTVIGGDAIFDPEVSPDVRAYRLPITVCLDIRYADPEQTEDWAYHYERVLDQIFSTVTNKFCDLTAFTTPQQIAWPFDPNTPGTPRQTVPFATGTVHKLFIAAHHIGLAAGDETRVGRTISLALEFDVIET